MYPELFRIGSFSVQSHDFFVLLGTVCAMAFFGWEASRRGVSDPRVAWVACGAIAGGAVFAKVSTVWRYLAADPEPTLLGALQFGGKSILGGLAGAYIGAIVTKRLLGYRESTGDLFAPAVALGLAIGRWGCLLSEQVGTPTALPWGISVSAETAARMPMCATCAPGVAMHPSFVYEIVFHALLFGVLLRLRPRITVRGELLNVFLYSYAVFRFAVEFVRGNEQVWLGLSFSQLFLIPAIVAFSVYFGRGFHTGRYSVPRFEMPA